MRINHPSERGFDREPVKFNERMRCNSFAAIGVGLAAVSVGVAVYSAANAPGMPETPDLGAASREASNVEARLLPTRRAIEAAAQQGGVANVDIGDRTEYSEFVRAPGPEGGRRGAMVPYVASEWLVGGKYNPDGRARTPRIEMMPRTVPGQRTYDFTGYGEADVQAQQADAMARLRLELGDRYGLEFIDEALAQAERADPESFQARDLMDELIQQQINRKPDYTVQNTLESQVQGELDAARGGRLDRETQGNLDAAVLAAGGARGDAAPAGDFSQDLTTGFAGEARRRAAEAKPLGLLTSGTMPEDVEYRREQQNMANLSARMNGQTPQSQFGSLSGAQNGPTPTTMGQPLATLPQGAGQAGQAAALQSWNTQLGAASQQANPWMAGLTSMLGLASAAGNAGWQPLAKKA